MTIRIDHLTEAELRTLNREIVQRLQFLCEIKAQVDMQEFKVGDRVSFQSNPRETVEGMVIRCNRKTVTLVTDDHHQWNVAPGLLRRKATSEPLDITTQALALARGGKVLGSKKK